ncbi:hypothetical protein Afil01_48530 [Actinorhabdospora filicis]|uniref:DUF4352 domain-containing protein n=1 Tax=Actinorhabdospora filicis TaxID=1785913 RepID=A0A9W6WBY5_9ACTN|nr:hypothetical protein [Actinorhabdospora filicis]GLZ80046.1 hypothetical protein Afil01_48530 [Actinorhabdospora filicis]
MKKTVLAVTAVLSLGLLAACGADDKPASPKSDTNKSQDTPKDDKKPAGNALDAPYKWEDGFVATLTGFERKKSSDTASPGNTDYVEFTIQVENGTGKDVELTLFSIACKTGTDGKASEEIFDEGVGAQLTGTVQAGKKATGKFGCAMPTSDKTLQVEISPNYGDDITKLPKTAVLSGDVK